MINHPITELRKRGFSLREISKALGISYSTVQRGCTRVKMPNDGKLRYHSKVKGLTKIIKLKKGLNKHKVRIMSSLLFDGAVYENDYHYSIMYINNSKELINQFMDDMHAVYHVEPSSFETAKTYYRVKYISKCIYNDLTKYFKSFSTSDSRCSIPSAIMGGSKLFKTIILTAFWENEGSISKEGKLSADLKSFRVIKQLSQLHNEFGLDHNISRYWKNGWAYKLFLYKSKENYERFLNLGLFSKANVTKGHFIGKKKVDVLREYFNHHYS